MTQPFGTLPMNRKLPAGLSAERPGNSLASLSLTDPLKHVMTHVLRQWERADEFSALAKYGIQPIRQLLFYGPPGNGKTTACQWIASQLSIPLYRVRCEQLVGWYIGMTASNVGAVMEWLAEAEPCVVLFDEIESIFPSRSMMGDVAALEIGSAMTVFWQRLDRWTNRQLFVFATNMHERLDPAMLSRIEMHLEFGPPTADQIHDVICYWRETLHEYGGAAWGGSMLRTLAEYTDLGSDLPWSSFRSLWQAISRNVSAWILDPSESPNPTPKAAKARGNRGKS